MKGPFLSSALGLPIVSVLLAALAPSVSWGNAGRAVQDRLDVDIAAGRPVVVHVVVALCDNVNQGIVPVPPALGNGQDPRTNLYWGALYGVRTHLHRAAGWSKIDALKPNDRRILDRVVLHAKLSRGETSVPTYVVADAWDGAHIQEALQVYFRMVAGDSAETIAVRHGPETFDLRAGGAAHILAYVGHNGLMDGGLTDVALGSSGPTEIESPARSAIVLACASRSYFLDHLRAARAHPLLLTTGLMAPEAYTLDSAIRAWVEERTSSAVVQAAAAAYHQYQGCGLTAARRLFWGEP